MIETVPAARYAALIAATLSAFVAAASAHAAPQITTQSSVYVERRQGDTIRRLEPANRLARGDRVITVVNWQRYSAGPPAPFTITNPLPSSLAYQASAWDDQDVSVDGGRTWGRLGTLKLGRRVATPEDVTHVRWRIMPHDSRRGRIAYSGIVR